MSETKEYTPLKELLLRIDETVDNGSTVPFSNKKMVDADQLHELVDEVRMSVPPEIKRAQEVELQRKSILEEAEKKAEDIKKAAEDEKAALIKEAKAEAERLVSEQEIIEKARQVAKEYLEGANQEAADIISRAKADAENIITDANNRKQSIMDAMVSNINSTLTEASSLLSGDVEKLTKSLEDVNRMREAVLKLLDSGEEE